eukprot:Em0006g252a
MTTTCTTYDSGVLLLYFNGHQVLLYLSSSVGENVTYVSITRRVIYTAYKAWVDEANGIIMSEITCTGLGGLSEPLNISCKSNDDKAGVCTAELGNASCATPTSIPSTVTTPPDSLNTNAIVGCVVGALMTIIIIIIIVVIVIVTRCHKCGGGEVHRVASRSRHDDSNTAELLNTTSQLSEVAPERDSECPKPEECTVGHRCVLPATAVKPYITELEATETQNTSTVLKRDDSAGTGDGHHAPKPGDPSDPAPKPGDPSDPAPEPGDPSDPAPKPGDPSDPALETECFTIAGVQECTYQEKHSERALLKSEYVLSSDSTVVYPLCGTTANGHSKQHSTKRCLKQ